MGWQTEEPCVWRKSWSARKSDLQYWVILPCKRQLNHFFPFTTIREAHYINTRIATNEVFFQLLFICNCPLIFLFLSCSPVQQNFFEWWCPKLDCFLLLRSQQCWLEWNSPGLWTVLRLMHLNTHFPFLQGHQEVLCLLQWCLLSSDQLTPALGFLVTVHSVLENFS